MGEVFVFVFGGEEWGRGGFVGWTVKSQPIDSNQDFQALYLAGWTARS